MDVTGKDRIRKDSSGKYGIWNIAEDLPSYQQLRIYLCICNCCCNAEAQSSLMYRSVKLNGNIIVKMRSKIFDWKYLLTNEKILEFVYI